MKVVVTGASGYIGRHVVTRLLDCGDEVIACDLVFDGVDERAIKSGLNIFSREKDVYEKLGKPELLIHMAWKDGFAHNSDCHMVNLSDHYIFLKNMIEAGCKKISVMGSMHEIGYWEGSVDENTPCKPLSQYGVAKNALRQSMELLTKSHDFKLYWLRAYYIYGDDLRGSSIFSKITAAEEEGKKSFPFTTGKNKYDFINVKDLASQIVSASKQESITGIINVCTGKPVSLAEQVEKFILERGFNIKLEYGAFPERSYDSPGVWGDSRNIDKIMKESKNIR